MRYAYQAITSTIISVIQVTKFKTSITLVNGFLQDTLFLKFVKKLNWQLYIRFLQIKYRPRACLKQNSKVKNIQGVQFNK